ncbi:MAG: MFS transporter [Saprospiraceae bacterium]|nr:MFS transporter [Saprospiraceae bacterium]
MLRRTANLYRESFGGLSKDIWLLAFVTFINRSGTMVIPFMSVYLTGELHFTLPQAGWVMFCFGVGSVFGSLLGGRLTDQFGYYWVQFGSLILTGIMFISLQFVHSMLGICLAVFILSIVADAFRPANHASIAVYSKPKNRARSYSLIRLAINLGFSIGPAIGGIIAGAFGFKWLFWADGLTCIAAAMLFRVFLSQKQEQTEQSGDESKPVLASASAYRDHTFLIFIALTTLGGIVFMQLFSTIPVYCKQHFQMTESQIGLLLAGNGLLIALIEMPLVYTLDSKMPQKLRVVAWGVLLFGLSYLLLNIANAWVGTVIIYAIVITFGEILMMPFSNVFAIERSSPTTRGQYMALYSSSWSVAHIIAPVLGMQIAAHLGWTALWYLIAGLSILIFLGYRMLEKRPVVATQQL